MSNTSIFSEQARSFEDILDDIEALSRTHLLSWRIGVGRLLLRDLFGGDPEAYFSHAPAKEARFGAFVAKHGESLRCYGLSETQARQSIIGAVVFDRLPEAVRKPLFLSQVLELARLHDTGHATELAQAAVQNDWSVVALRDVVDAVNAGLPLAGLDVPEPALPVPPSAKVQPGRLISRAETWADDLGQWAGQWSGVDKQRLRGLQKQRVAAAVAKARVELEKLAKSLGV